MWNWEYMKNKQIYFTEIDGKIMKFIGFDNLEKWIKSLGDDIEFTTYFVAAYSKGCRKIGKNKKMKETIMYCHKYKSSRHNDYFYTNFFSHPKTTQMCDNKENVYKVKVRELKNGEESIYWGWWDNKDNAFIFVHPTRDILSICFPYSMKTYVEKGEGKDYNVIIEEIEIEIIGSDKK